MSARTLPPPQPPIVLTRSYKSRGIKGGTVIAEDILDPEVHAQALLDADTYRTAIGRCRCCGTERWHAHCFRERLPRPAVGAAAERRSTAIRLYRCATQGCGAVVTVLPAFIARQLWRTWETVQSVAQGAARVPKTTWLRWSERLSSSAVPIVQLLFALASGLLSRRQRKALAPVETRASLIHAAAECGLVDATRPFARLASWIHRLEPGIRLM